MFKLYALSLLLIVPTISGAQHHIGLEAGFLGSYLHKHPFNKEILIHPGFIGGIHYSYQGENRLSIHSGVKIEQYGFDYHFVLVNENDEILGEGKLKNRIMGINIPFRVGYRFGGNWTFTPTGGVSFNYALSANSILPKSITGLGSLSKTNTFLDQLNRFNICAELSLEVASILKKVEIFGSFGYRRTILNLTKTTNSADNTQWYSLVEFTIGARIPLLQKVKETLPYIKPEDLD